MPWSIENTACSFPPRPLGANPVRMALRWNLSRQSWRRSAAIPIRLCTHRAAVLLRLRRRHRQRCRAPRAPGNDGPSWLIFMGHVKDSLWSVDLFRCESILLRGHWVMLVMDVFTRRLVGFGVEPADIDGVSVCRMFNHATAGQPNPQRLRTDHDPLFFTVGSQTCACSKSRWLSLCPGLALLH